MRRLLLLSLLVVGCSARTPLPLSVAAGLLSGCLEVGTQAKCDCVVAEMQKRMSLEEWREWEASIRMGSQPDPRYAKMIAESQTACAGR